MKVQTAIKIIEKIIIGLLIILIIGVVILLGSMIFRFGFRNTSLGGERSIVQIDKDLREAEKGIEILLTPHEDKVTKTITELDKRIEYLEGHRWYGR